MDAQEKIDIIMRSPTEELISKEDLTEKVNAGEKLKHYIGYEVSGLIHLGNWLACFKIADLQKAGAETSVFMADFHSMINNKLGGDPAFIKKVAREYFEPAMKVGIKVAGGDPNKTKFILASEIYDPEYWASVLRVGKEVTLSRVKRSITIMGREIQESIPSSWLIYPLMQAADIFKLGANIAHAGMDQRKIHVIAREAGQAVAGYKPIALHHHMLLGLHKPKVWPVPENKEDRWAEFKMSKSVSGSAIFVNDSEEEIRRKITSAFCPETAEYNPVLDWTKHVAFAPQMNCGLEVKRPEKYGGDRTYTKYSELEKDFLSKKLHPSDLKNSLADFLVNLLEPFRKEMKNNKIAEKLSEKITR
jgi:tyrosyl-tRNA synthetase